MSASLFSPIIKYFYGPFSFHLISTNYEHLPYVMENLALMKVEVQVGRWTSTWVLCNKSLWGIKLKKHTSMQTLEITWDEYNTVDIYALPVFVLWSQFSVLNFLLRGISLGMIAHVCWDSQLSFTPILLMYAIYIPFTVDFLHSWLYTE